MALFTNIIVHGIIYVIILTGYLLFIMIKFSPRIWGFSDYPKTITDNVPPQTREEKRKATITGLPFFIIALGFPIISTLLLEQELGGHIDFISAFLNIFALFMFMNAADLILLDWIIVGTITPKFVIIPGTEQMKYKEYREFRLYHTKGHVWGTIAMVILSMIMALFFAIF